MERKNRLPSGYCCFRCCIPFASTRDGRRHGVRGKIFWEKYKAFYSESNIKLTKESDILCSACHANINHANGHGRKEKLRFFRLRQDHAPAVQESGTMQPESTTSSHTQMTSERSSLRMIIRTEPNGNVKTNPSVVAAALARMPQLVREDRRPETFDGTVQVVPAQGTGTGSLPQDSDDSEDTELLAVSEIKQEVDSDCELIREDDNEGNLLMDISVAAPLLPSDLYMECNHEEDDNADNHFGQQNQHIPGTPSLTAPDTEEETMEDDDIETEGNSDTDVQYISIMAPNKECRAELLRNFAKDKSFQRSSGKDPPTASNCSKIPETITRTTPQIDEIVQSPSNEQMSGVEELTLTETQTGESLPKKESPTDVHDMCHQLSRKFADGSILNTNFLTTHSPECPCQEDLAATPKISASHYVLHMWRIRHYKQGSVVNPAIPAVACSSIAALSKILTFLHSPDSTISSEDLSRLIPMEHCRLVNPYVAGLFLLQGLLQLSPGEIDLFRSEVSKMTNCRYKDLVLAGLENFTDRYKMVMAIYQAILLHDWEWDRPFALDGDEQDNFNGIEKRDFHFRLYFLYASNSHASVSVLHFLMKDMTPTSSSDADGLIICKGVTPEDLRHTARVHSIVLQLRQDSSSDEHEQNLVESEISLRTFLVEPRHMKSFINMLYRGPDVVDDTMAELPLKVLMGLSNIFKIRDPINLAFGDAISLPDTPKRMQICMDLYDYGGDVYWIEPILRQPSRYLTADNTKYLRVAQMRELLMSDNLELNELEVYKLVLEYCHADSISDDIGTYPTTETRLACLLPTVRFATMPATDFNYVIDQNHLGFTDICIFFGAINNPQISVKARFPEKYHKSNIPRHSANPR